MSETNNPQSRRWHWHGKFNGRAPLLDGNDAMTHPKPARQYLETTGWKRTLNSLLGRLTALRLCRDNIQSEGARVGSIFVKCAATFRLIILSPVRRQTKPHNASAITDTLRRARRLLGLLRLGAAK